MDDRRLAEELRNGDRGGLAELYDHYAERLYDYCHSLLREPGRAADAVQDVFVAAHAHAGVLRDPGRLGPWLYALVRTQCGRQLSDAGIDLFPSGGPAGFPPGGPGGPGGPGASAGEAADPGVDPGLARMRGLARDALGRLEEDDREVLDLAVRHGLHDDDLAAVLGTSRSEAQARTTGARARFEGAVAALVAPAGVDEQTSAAALVGDLPPAVPPAGLRDRVLHAVFDPELVSGRVHVAAQAGPFDTRGFPVQAGARSRALRRWAPAVAAVLLVLTALGAAGGGLLAMRGGEDEPDGGELARAPASAPSDAPVTYHTAGAPVPSPTASSPAPTPTPTVTRSDSGSGSTGDGPDRMREGSRKSARPPEPTRFTVRPQRINLGGSRSSATVRVRSTGQATIWGTQSSTELLTASPNEGMLPEGATAEVTITLDRSRVTGSGSGTVTFATVRGQWHMVTVTWSG